MRVSSQSIQPPKVAVASDRQAMPVHVSFERRIGLCEKPTLLSAYGRPVPTLQQDYCREQAFALIENWPTVSVNERLNPTLSATPPCGAPFLEPGATPLLVDSSRRRCRCHKKDLQNLQIAQEFVCAR